jgi:hypothetical protein
VAQNKLVTGDEFYGHHPSNTNNTVSVHVPLRLKGSRLGYGACLRCTCVQNNAAILHQVAPSSEALSPSSSISVIKMQVVGF